MNRPIHQHWVPQFYLRCFATPESRDTEQSQAWIFSKDTADGDETLTSIRNICGKRYLYSPVNKSGERIWDIETKLSELEATIGKIWPSIAEGFIDISTPANRKGLSLFIAVMRLRNPDIRKDVENLHKNLIKLFENIPSREDGTPNIESVEIAGETYSLDTSRWSEYHTWCKNDHDQFFTDLIETEASSLAERLMKKRWSIIYSECETFITTDKPVLVQHQSRQTFGLGTPDTIVSFPLSPKRLLIMDDMHHEPANQYYPLNESSVGAFNLNIWQNGSRFMITGRPIHQVLLEMVKWAEAHAPQGT